MKSLRNQFDFEISRCRTPSLGAGYGTGELGDQSNYLLNKRHQLVGIMDVAVIKLRFRLSTCTGRMPQG